MPGRREFLGSESRSSACLPITLINDRLVILEEGKEDDRVAARTDWWRAYDAWGPRRPALFDGDGRSASFPSRDALLTHLAAGAVSWSAPLGSIPLAPCAASRPGRSGIASYRKLDARNIHLHATAGGMETHRCTVQISVRVVRWSLQTVSRLGSPSTYGNRCRRKIEAAHFPHKLQPAVITPK